MWRMQHQTPPLVIDPSWTPTAESINALPTPLREYILDLQANVDAVETMRENFRLWQEIAALRKKLAGEPDDFSFKR
ncbi:MAG: hypothetical protein WCB50_26555 [Pseudolabrys sp.]